MAAERQLRDYPPGLDDVARRFDITVVELLEEIANGSLEVVRPDDTPEETKESVLENLKQAVRELKQGESLPIATLWDDLDDE